MAWVDDNADVDELEEMGGYFPELKIVFWWLRNVEDNGDWVPILDQHQGFRDEGTLRRQADELDRLLGLTSKPSQLLFLVRAVFLLNPLLAATPARAERFLWQLRDRIRDEIALRAAGHAPPGQIVVEQRPLGYYNVLIPSPQTPPESAERGQSTAA